MAKRAGVTTAAAARKKRKLARTDNEDAFAATQRHLGRRLRAAADSRAGAAAAAVRVRAQQRCLHAAAQTRHPLARAHALAELAAQLLAALALPQTARCLQRRVLGRVRCGLSTVVARAARLPSAEKRVRLLSRELQALATRALAIPARKSAAEQQRLATERRQPLLALATHQWVPPTLWSIYESVEREYRRRLADDLDDASERESESDGGAPAPSAELRAAMRVLVERMRDLNPYSHLHVLFQPPPPAAAGESEWRVAPSAAVARVAGSLRAPLARLHQFAFWLESPRRPDESAAFCEREFDGLIRMVRDFSTHFHFVLLFLYSVAMGRADASAESATATSVLRQAATHARGIDARGAYGISSTVTLTDPLLQQSYAFFPEVLVFLDAWRRDESARAYGFASDEAVGAFVVDVARPERRDQRVLAELASLLKDVFHTWRRTNLGAYKFGGMDIHELGELERIVKTRLRGVVDLLYKQNLAAWMRRRRNNWEPRFLHGVQLLEPKASVSVGVEAEEEEEQQPHSSPSSPSTPAPSNENADPQRPQRLEPEQPEDAPAVGVLGSIEPEDAEQSTINEAPALSAEIASPAAGGVPIDGSSRRLRQQNPVNCGRFRAPGVLVLKKRPSKRSAPKKPQATGDDDAEADRLAERHRGREPSDASDRSSSLPKSSARESSPEQPRSLRYSDPMRLEDIYAWGDGDIDTNEQETERVYELQEQLLTQREKLSLEAALQEVNGTWLARNLPKRPRRGLSLLESAHRMLQVARAAVCDAETVALHGAAEALICQPSLREKGKPKEAAAAPLMTPSDCEDSVAALQELRSTVASTRHVIAEMLKNYRGEQSSAWATHLAFFARASKELLGIASECAEEVSSSEVSSSEVSSSFETPEDEVDGDPENGPDECQEGDSFADQPASRYPANVATGTLELPSVDVSAVEPEQIVEVVA